MYSHLEHIPCLTTLTAGCLSCRDFERLRRKSNWSLHTEILRLGTLKQLGADLLEGLYFSRREGDTDLVHFLRAVSEGCSESAGAWRTGPSPKSFSGFWKDMIADSCVRCYDVLLMTCDEDLCAKQDLNNLCSVR